ncbi:MAG: hypothetical protein ACRDT4_25180 [Micromonosporaceae bacterium]
MDMWDIVRVMWRRWYVVVPLLLVVMGTTLSAGAFIHPEYTSTASVLLVPPADRPESLKPGEKGNPWLDVGPVAMAEAVSIAVQSKSSRDTVAADGVEALYEVGVLPRSSIVLIEVSATSPQQARAGATRVIALIEDEVDRRQAPYQPKPTHQISTQVLDPGDNVVASQTGLRRGQAMILFAGMLLTAGLAIAVDAVLRRQRPRDRQPVRPAPPTLWAPDQRLTPDSDATITMPAIRPGTTTTYDIR